MKEFLFYMKTRSFYGIVENYWSFNSAINQRWSQLRMTRCVKPTSIYFSKNWSNNFQEVGALLQDLEPERMPTKFHNVSCSQQIISGGGDEQTNTHPPCTHTSSGPVGSTKNKNHKTLSGNMYLLITFFIKIIFRKKKTAQQQHLGKIYIGIPEPIIFGRRRA